MEGSWANGGSFRSRKTRTWKTEGPLSTTTEGVGTQEKEEGGCWEGNNMRKAGGHCPNKPKLSPRGKKKEGSNQESGGSDTKRA